MHTHATHKPSTRTRQQEGHKESGGRCKCESKAGRCVQHDC
jgi:hypothetical protein